MIQLALLLCVLMICYFAIRVNRVELRMNALEKALNQAVREGKLDTSYLGKPFGGDALGLKDFCHAVKDAWQRSGK